MKMLRNLFRSIALPKALKFFSSVLSHKDSFNLFCFLALNFSFAFVELFYGIMSNSLGLICDSFHMFLDSMALLTGLAASVISRWPPDPKFTFGYKRAEMISGFVNGLVLMLMAFYIFKEAIERVFEQPHIHHDRLFLVSLMGFLVNVVGIFVFNHGHSSDGAHSHGGSCHHHHHHDHENTIDQYHSHKSTTTNTKFRTFNHHGDHNHEIISMDIANDSQSLYNIQNTHFSRNKCQSSNQILRGVFLHIVADTLGSIAVMISSFFVSNYELHFADTLCSICISILIFVSAIPLAKDTLLVLMEASPSHLTQEIKDSLLIINKLPGVYQIMNFHTWTISSNSHCATLSIILAPTVDSVVICQRIRTILAEIGIENSTIQTVITN